MNAGQPANTKCQQQRTKHVIELGTLQGWGCVATFLWSHALGQWLAGLPEQDSADLLGSLRIWGLAGPWGAGAVSGGKRAAQLCLTHPPPFICPMGMSLWRQQRGKSKSKSIVPVLSKPLPAPCLLTSCWPNKSHSLPQSQSR